MSIWENKTKHTHTHTQTKAKIVIVNFILKNKYKQKTSKRITVTKIIKLQEQWELKWFYSKLPLLRNLIFCLWLLLLKGWMTPELIWEQEKDRFKRGQRGQKELNITCVQPLPFRAWKFNCSVIHCSENVILICKLLCMWIFSLSICLFLSLNGQRYFQMLFKNFELSI